MKSVKPGDKVRLHYRGTLDDGTVFESSFGKLPLEFTIGQQMVIAAFEGAVVGMREGEKRIFSVKPADAYGEYRQDRVIEIDRSTMAPGPSPRTGSRLPLRLPDGKVAEVVVTRVTPGTVTVDANHPLAGKSLAFEVELLEILSGPK